MVPAVLKLCPAQTVMGDGLDALGSLSRASGVNTPLKAKH